jgi:hypothetical protein
LLWPLFMSACALTYLRVNRRRQRDMTACDA